MTNGRRGNSGVPLDRSEAHRGTGDRHSEGQMRGLKVVIGDHQPYPVPQFRHFRAQSSRFVAVEQVESALPRPGCLLDGSILNRVSPNTPAPQLGTQVVTCRPH